jgi:Icc-related predicted phosphoesterase
MNNDIAFFGDPHGNFDALRRIGLLPDEELPSAVVMMGDYDPVRPLHEEAESCLLRRVPWHFIHGNHECDSEEWHDRVFDERSAAYNISCRVVELPNGIRVAGLGGVFRGRIWNPRDGEGVQHYRSRQDWIYKNGHQKRWRRGIPLRHRDSIFPEDFEVLADMQADVLVTHEGPSCMRLPRADGSWEEVGFKEIDELAEMMGVKAIVHGHHHREYDAKLDNGILVFGTAKARMRRLSPRQLGLQKQIWIGAVLDENRYQDEASGKIDVGKKGPCPTMLRRP